MSDESTAGTQQKSEDEMSRGEMFARGYLAKARDASPTWRYTNLGREELDVPPWKPYAPYSDGAGDLVRQWYVNGRIDDVGLEKGLELVESRQSGLEL